MKKIFFVTFALLLILPCFYKENQETVELIIPSSDTIANPQNIHGETKTATGEYLTAILVNHDISAERKYHSDIIHITSKNSDSLEAINTHLENELKENHEIEKRETIKKLKEEPQELKTLLALDETQIKEAPYFTPILTKDKKTSNAQELIALALIISLPLLLTLYQKTPKKWVHLTLLLTIITTIAFTKTIKKKETTCTISNLNKSIRDDTQTLMATTIVKMETIESLNSILENKNVYVEYQLNKKVKKNTDMVKSDEAIEKITITTDDPTKIILLCNKIQGKIFLPSNEKIKKEKQNAREYIDYLLQTQKTGKPLPFLKERINELQKVVLGEKILTTIPNKNPSSL